MKVSHSRAAAIVIAMFEAGVEGSETLLQYIDEQSNCAELTDRELTLRAWRRSDEAAYLCADVLRRLAILEGRAG